MTQGYGQTISFSTGFFAKILSLSHNIKRASIDMTHSTSTSGYMEKEPSDIIDPGQLTVQLLFNPATTRPIANNTEEITITYSDGSTTVCDGFLVSLSNESPHDNRITATAVIEFTGVPVDTPG